MFIKFTYKSRKIKPKKILKSTLVFLLVTSWLLTGYPGFWLPAKDGESLRFPPKIYEIKAATNTETFTSSTTWTAPPGVTSVAAECWGTGGSGGGSTSSTRGGSGGGAGAYAKTNTVAVTAGAGYTVTIGALGSTGTGAGGVGGDTSFTGDSSQKCLAKGGGGGAANGGTGGTGGSSTTSTGDVKYSGGNGYTTAVTAGGGGGGSGGTGSIGNNSTSSTGATAVTGGGNGGNGGSVGNNGSNPTTPPGGAGGGGGCQAKSGACSTGGGSKATTGATGSAGKVSITYTVYTILGSGTDPSSTIIAPDSGIIDAGTFTVQSTVNTDSITALTVTLASSGTPYNGLAEVRITDNGGTTTYFSAVTSFTGNSVNFSGGTAIPVTTTETAYKIRITPKTHVNMPVPPGATYALSPYISAFTSTNTQTGTDSNANTITIDNTSPNGATSVGGSGGTQAVTLNWTTSSSSDFSTTNGSVILRWTGSSAGAEVPAEGNTSYVAGNTISTATVACVISSNASTALSKVDGNGGSVGCNTTPLLDNQAYTYKVFQIDTNGNYDVGVSMGTFTTSAAANTSFTQNKYRWYYDNDAINPTVAWGALAIAENTAIPIIPAGYDPPDTTQKLRLRTNIVVNTSALSAGTNYFKLEYKAGTDGSCTTGSWTDVGTGVWTYATSTVTDGSNITSILSDTTSGKGEQYVKSKPSSLNNVGANIGEIIEYDFHIIGGTAVPNTTYSFRVVGTDSGGTAETILDAYTNCPTLTTEPGTADLMRHGQVFNNGLKKGFFWVN